MIRLRSITLASGVVLALTAVSLAQIGREVVAVGKASTAYVEVGEGARKGSGSGFCVDASGLFVTNAHVVKDVGPKDQVKLVLQAGEAEQKEFVAKVYRRDEDVDLALLQVVPAASVPFKPLPLGRDEDLFDTMEAVVLGYPFGTLRAVGKDSYPNVNVKILRITSLIRGKDRRELAHLELDGQINPGNSGGPLVDSSGKVIGVAQSTIVAAGINYAIPAGQLSAFLTTPGLEFNPPRLTNEDRSRPVTWTIRAIPSTPSAKLPEGLRVALTLTVDGKTARTFDAKESAPGTYQVTLKPIPVDEVAPDINHMLVALVELKRQDRVLTNLKRSTPIPRQSPLELQQAQDDLAVPEIGGELKLGPTPLGMARSIRPPSLAIGTARVGNASPPEGKAEIRRLLGHTNQVMDLALSRDGRTLVTAGYDGVPRIWDVATGTVRRELKENKLPVYALALSPDNRQILSGGEDRVARLWDVETGALVREYRGQNDVIFAIAFTPDGQRFLSAGGAGPSNRSALNRQICVQDVASGRVIARWAGHNGVIDALAVSPDGKLALSAASDQTARIWDVATGRQIHSFPGQSELGLHAIFSRDGRRAIVASANHLIRVYDVANGKELFVLRGHTSKVDSFATSPDGRVLVSGSWPEATFRFWDLTDGRPIGQIVPDGNPQLGAFTPDGRRLFYAFSDNTVREFAVPETTPAAPRSDTGGVGEPLVRKPGGQIDNVTVGGGGRYLFLTLKGARELAVFDTNAADIVRRIPLASPNALVAAGGKILVVAYPDQKTFQRWDLATWAKVGDTIPSPINARIKSLALGADSDGPMLVGWSPGLPSDGLPNDQTRFNFVDPRSLEVLKPGPIGRTGSQAGLISPKGSFSLFHQLREKIHARASADGRFFTIWQTTSSPTGFQTLQLFSDGLQAYYTFMAANHLAPGPDGRLVYTGSQGPFAIDSNGQFVPRPNKPGQQVSIPSNDPSYFLGVDGLRSFPYRGPATGPVSVTVFVAGDGSALFKMQGLDEMTGPWPNEPLLDNDFSLEKRFHLVPAAGLLITIPPSDDRLVVRRVDIDESLRRVRGNAPALSSPSLLKAESGQPFRSQLKVKGDVPKFRLARGPEGLSLSPDGELKWQIPTTSQDRDETVLVGLTEGNLAERFHLIQIQVR